MYETLQIMGYLPYQLVQDFFHQPYHWLWIKVWLIVWLITCWVLDWAVLLKEAGPRPCWVWNVGWQTPHQDFSGSWGRWTYIWCSSRMLSSPHDITRSTSNTTTIRYEDIQRHSGQSSITSTCPVAPPWPWGNMSVLLHAETKSNSWGFKTARVACSHPPPAPGVSADLWFSCNDRPKAGQACLEYSYTA